MSRRSSEKVPLDTCDRWRHGQASTSQYDQFRSSFIRAIQRFCRINNRYNGNFDQIAWVYRFVFIPYAQPKLPFSVPFEFCGFQLVTILTVYVQVNVQHAWKNLSHMRRYVWTTRHKLPFWILNFAVLNFSRLLKFINQQVMIGLTAFIMSQTTWKVYL